MGEVRDACHGEPALPARLEPWMTELLGDAAACARLVAEHGSPVNVLVPGALVRNADELVAAGRARGVEVGVFLARKANKALALVEAAAEAGHGVDVASERELAQVLDAGVPGERVIVSAAVKPRSLLERAVRAGAVVSLDNHDEVELLGRACDEFGMRARVAPRLAPVPGEAMLPTRFGLLLRAWASLDWRALPCDAVGVHFHLHGYATDTRVRALGEALQLVDALREQGQPVEFVDAGGGVPMSYLESEADWDRFWDEHRAALRGEREPLTWNGHGLGLSVADDEVTGAPRVYPSWQRQVRGEWLGELLDSEVAGEPAASALSRRGLRLHLEPGRALVDGCGLTLAEVAFVKERSDGVGLVGLLMNRTQLRTTSDDFLVDPLLVRTQPPGPAREGFLVGAYCIEDELLMLRRFAFPAGVAVGDLVAFPNTAGYFMHILESASHQIPLAANVVWDGSQAVVDAIDASR